MTSSAGNSPPEGFFSRGGCHPCRVLAESEVVGEARKGRRIPGNPHRRFPSEQAKTGKQAGSPQIVRLDPSSSSASLSRSIVPLFFSFVLLRVSSRFLSSRPVSCRPVSRRAAKRSNDGRPCSVLSRIERASCRVTSARAIDRPIGRSNQRIAEPTEGPTNETRYVQASSQQRANERRPARERAKGRLVVSFSFARSRGVRYRLGEPIPFDGQV